MKLARALAPWLAFAAVLIGTLVSAPDRTRMWDARTKLLVARTFAAGGGLQIEVPADADESLALKGVHGRRVTHFPILACLAWLPTVAVEKLTGRELGALPPLLMLSGLAALLVAWGLRAGVTPPIAVAAALLTCLGTALWPMSAEGQDNIVESLVLAVLLWAAAGDRARDWVVAGAAMGAGYCTRQTISLMAIPALLLLAGVPGGLRPRLVRLSGVVAAGAPWLLLSAWYDVYRFGRPFWTPAGLGSYLSRPLSHDHWVAMAGYLVSPGKGVLWYSPLLLLPLWLGRDLWKRRRWAVLAIGAHFAATVIFCGLWQTWHGDWAWGPRYVQTICLAITPACWIIGERSGGWRPAARTLAGAAAALALLFSGLAAMGSPAIAHQLDFVHRAAARKLIHTTPGEPPRDPRNWRYLYFTPSSSALAHYATYLWRNARGELYDGDELFAGAMRVLAALFLAAMALLVTLRLQARPLPPA